MSAATVLAATTPTLTQSPFWYLTRSTGIVAFLLLTVALAFGVAATQRSLASPAWPRFATQDLHRNVSLLGTVFIVVHVVTTVVDGYAPVGWWSLVVPGASAYKTAWVALGTVAFDLVLLLTATSLLRLRMNPRVWRAVHWAAYLLWPLTLLHFLKTGTDARGGGFGVWIGLGALLVVLAAVGVRVATGDSPPRPVRSVRSAR